MFFGLWKHISTFYTVYSQSPLMVEKILNLPQNLSAFVRGWQLQFCSGHLWVNIWTIQGGGGGAQLQPGRTQNIRQDHVSRRRIKEAIRIHQGMSELNTYRDVGLDIPAVILQLVSCDPEGSCDTSGHQLPSSDGGREILPKIWEFFHH